MAGAKLKYLGNAATCPEFIISVDFMKITGLLLVEREGERL